MTSQPPPIATEAAAAAYASGWPVRPAVILTLVHGTTVSFWFLWILGTTQHPGVWHEGPFRLISDQQHLLFSAVNLILGLWLLGSLRSALRSGAGLRRGQAAGALLGLVLVGVLQTGAQALHRAWPAPAEGREAVDERLEAWDSASREVVQLLRSSIGERLVDHRERWSADQLHLRGSSAEGEVKGYIWRTGGPGAWRVRLQLQGVREPAGEQELPQGLTPGAGGAEMVGLVIDAEGALDTRETLVELCASWIPVVHD